MAFVMTNMASCLATTAVSMLASCGFQACRCAAGEVVKTSARLAYSILFFSSMVVAWVLRDYAKPMIQKIPWIMRGAMDPGDRWFGQQAVYRISLGTFLFFASLSAALYGVVSKSDRRDKFLQHGGWGIKGLLWLVSNVIPFFMPNGLVNAYSYLARAGSAVFIFIQILLLIDCAHAWNDAWVNEEDDRYLYGLLGMTVASYGGCLGIIIYLYNTFNPLPGCSFNVTMISLALVLCVAFPALSLHPRVKTGSLFPASLISLYCCYLCYGAMASEPKEYRCNSLGHRMNAATESTLAMGVVFTVLSIVYSAWRVGSSQSLLSFDTIPDQTANLASPPAPAADIERGGRSEDPRLNKLKEEDVAGAKPLLADVHPPVEEGMTRSDSVGAAAGAAGGVASTSNMVSKQEDLDAGVVTDPVGYSYSFFHAIFALAAMYLAMLMTGWSQGKGEEKDLIDVGWASVYVKITTMFACAVLYVWSLIAPILFPDRVF